MELKKRRSPRLKGFDYGANEEYFVTICTDKHKKILSDIIVGRGLAPAEVKLTTLGKIAEKQIYALSERYANVTVEKYVIMPDHIHLLIFIGGSETAGASPRPTLPDIICSFKSLITKELKKTYPAKKVWQTSFYDHVIRNEKDYSKHFDYIEDNPIMWIENRHII